MHKYVGIVAAAALTVGGLSLMGCEPNNNGGMTGGGTTDTYGNGPNARYQDTGNTGATLRPGTAAGANGAASDAGAPAPMPNGQNNTGGAAAGGNAAMPGTTGGTGGGAATGAGTTNGGGASGAGNTGTGAPANGTGGAGSGSGGASGGR